MPPPECEEILCKNAGNNIQAHMNWSYEPCNDFMAYCCSKNAVNTLRVVKSAQQQVDQNLHTLLSQNTTSGPYRKLGRLYGSCLRTNLSLTRIRLVLDQLGGYLSIGALGPISISPLLLRMNSYYGFNPLVSWYFDITHGRKPMKVLVIDSADASPIIEVS